jgi:hypothetical protein
MDYQSNQSNRASSAGYDHVKVPTREGGTRLLTREQFEALPLRDRVAHLIEGKAQFFRNGVSIAAREAMRG